MAEIILNNFINFHVIKSIHEKEMVKKYKLQDFHRFIDESGDMTFQHEKVIRGGSKIIVGLGASASFMIGMTYVKEDLSEARKKKNK